jgi:hypothetical protein
MDAVSPIPNDTEDRRYQERPAGDFIYRACELSTGWGPDVWNHVSAPCWQVLLDQFLLLPPEGGRNVPQDSQAMAASMID